MKSNIEYEWKIEDKLAMNRMINYKQFGYAQSDSFNDNNWLIEAYCSDYNGSTDNTMKHKINIKLVPLYWPFRISRIEGLCEFKIEFEL